MNDDDKTKTELVMENVHLRRKLAEAEQRLEWAKGRDGLTERERRILEMWPRFEDTGEPVWFGDVLDFGGDEQAVKEFRIMESGCAIADEFDYEEHFEHGQRVKRPAPEVLDADGVPIKVDDKLYDTETGCGRTVRSINANGSIEFDGLETRGWLTCRFTHTEPVFDADGVPINVGDTVYEAETGEEYKVDRVYDGTTEPDYPGHTVRCRRAGDCLVHVFKPCHLTHREPDSWERLFEDARQLDIGLDDTTDDYPRMSCVRDIVRCAKALAGVAE